MKNLIKINTTSVKNNSVNTLFSVDLTNISVLLLNAEKKINLLKNKNEEIGSSLKVLNVFILNANYGVSQTSKYLSEKKALVSISKNLIIELMAYNEDLTQRQYPEEKNIKKIEEIKLIFDKMEVSTTYELKELEELFLNYEILYKNILDLNIKNEKLIRDLSKLNGNYEGVSFFNNKTTTFGNSFIKKNNTIENLNNKDDIYLFFSLYLNKTLSFELQSKIDEKNKLDQLISLQLINDNFKKKQLTLKDYIKKHQDALSNLSELKDINDYRNIILKDLIFPVIQKEEILKKQWDDVCNKYYELLNDINDKVSLSKIKRTLSNLSLENFFLMNRFKVLEQILSDTSVDDFSNKLSFTTWSLISKNNPVFLDSFKKEFYKKYATKYNLEEIGNGLFFNENNDEYKLIFISFEQKNNNEINFIKKMENKYQKNIFNIKSIKNQNISKLIDIPYKGESCCVVVNYATYIFKDPSNLQGIKKLIKHERY